MRDHLNPLLAKRRNGVYRRYLVVETSRLHPPVLWDRLRISCLPLRSNGLNLVNILLIDLLPIRPFLLSVTTLRRPRKKLLLGPRSWRWLNEKLPPELNRSEHEPSCKSEIRSSVIGSKVDRKSIWNMVEVIQLVCLMLEVPRINLLHPCMYTSSNNNNNNNDSSTPRRAPDWHHSARTWALPLPPPTSRLNERMPPCRPRHLSAPFDRSIRDNLTRPRTSCLPRRCPSMIPDREVRRGGGRMITIIPRVIMLLCVIEVCCLLELLIASELEIRYF